MNFRKRIVVAATPKRVWQVLQDVERWTSWTASVRTIQRLDSNPLGLGSQVRIEQPKLHPGVWTIITWQPEACFVWTTSAPGLSVLASHVLEGIDAGCAITLEVSLRGVLSQTMGWLAESLTEHYLELEAEGLKQRSERQEDL